MRRNGAEGAGLGGTTPEELRDELVTFIRERLGLDAVPAVHRDAGVPGIKVYTPAGVVLVLVSWPIGEGQGTE